MKCTPELTWKYLRESDTKFFDPKRNTSLKEYLEAIFPGASFEYQSSIKKAELPAGIQPRRYVCDVICRDLKLVVEFDGLNHYMDTQVGINDIQRDKWFRELEYRTVRIPYWIQLSRAVIEDLFGIEISNEEFCQLDYSFYCPEKDTVDFNILPGNMCDLGRMRFLQDILRFRQDVRTQICRDLLACYNNVEHNYPKFLLSSVIPHDVWVGLASACRSEEAQYMLDMMKI